MPSHINEAIAGVSPGRVLEGSCMTEFNGRILIFGFGSVARCTLPVLFKHLSVSYENVTVIDLLDKSADMAQWVKLGVKYARLTITPQNLVQVLSSYLRKGDLLLDLAWEIDTIELLQWCHANEVLYINTSVEEWHPYGKDTYESTLYYRHMKIRSEISKWGGKGATAVLDHGANPGLISHFTKKALVDIAQAGIRENKFTHDKEQKIKAVLNRSDKCKWGELAMLLGVKVVHCSERDTQLSNSPKRVGEFVNTWSVEGFYEEGIAPAELGWGTHEKKVPENAVLPPEGPKNQIFLQQAGVNTWVRSFVPPNDDIIGMVVRHGEAFSLSEYLTVNGPDGKTPVYRPTVHYAYMPCDSAIASLHEMRAKGYKLQEQTRILRDFEITEGSDILGALVMGDHPYKTWWTGSDLSIDQARKIVSGQNATTLQVAGGLVGAITWMIEHPNEGVCLPDDVPYEHVLSIAMPYLGNFISQGYDWTPLKTKPAMFGHKSAGKAEETQDPWQFSSFLHV